MTLAYTTRAKRVLETSHPPVYYVSSEDIRMKHLKPAEGTSFCVRKAAAHYYDIETDERKERRGAWHCPTPVPAYASLKNYVAFYLSLMDACWVNGEKVEPKQGHFYGAWATSEIVGLFKAGPGCRGW